MKNNLIEKLEKQIDMAEEKRWGSTLIAISELQKRVKEIEKDINTLLEITEKQVELNKIEFYK